MSHFKFQFMKTIKNKPAYLAIFICLFFSACGPKPWPQDALIQLKQSGVLSEESNLVFLLSQSNEDQYLGCVIEQYKNKFPNYADFEKASIEDPLQIKKLRIPCLKAHAGYDINSIWNIIESNEQVRNLKFQLSEKYYLRYKELMMTRVRNNFHNMDGFISELTSNGNAVSTFIFNSDKECGEIVLNEMRIEKEKIENERIKLTALYNLLDDYSPYYGNINIVNETSKSVILGVVYYYYGQKWEGWVSEGWFDLSPGEKHIIKAPLNSDGLLNRIIYYCAKFKDSPSWDRQWKGTNAFIVLDNAMRYPGDLHLDIPSLYNEQFKIPNADKMETRSYSKNFKFYYVFKEKDIGSSVDCTINIID